MSRVEIRVIKESVYLSREDLRAIADGRTIVVYLADDRMIEVSKEEVSHSTNPERSR